MVQRAVQTAVHTQRALCPEIVKVNALIRSAGTRGVQLWSALIRVALIRVALTGRQTARRKVRVVGRL
jgi:hypothetical protein